ncbi:hypothetical protein ACLVWU_04505 [Bdellovibrio sp. HCB290]|uniref:hypothetical protein n=1 Tax=Bdellovibrio sp. HCB290 TaxID=3394356 RepID=UPI0039B408FF
MRKLLTLALLLIPYAASANADAPAISAWVPTGSSKISASYFGYYSSEVNDFNTGNGSVYMYNLLALNYKLDQRFTVSVRPTFTYDSEGVRYGYEMPSKTEMADSHIALIDKTPLSLPYDIKTKAIYKLFVPTAPDQIEAGTYGGVGMDFEAARDLPMGFSVGYYGRGWALAQKNSTYISNEGKTPRMKATQSGQIEHWLRATKYFGDRLNVSQGVGVKDEFYNGSDDENQRHEAFQSLETNLNFSVNDNIDLSLGVAQSTPASQPFKIYDNEYTSYVIMTSVRM